jgi:pyruvate carboxylase
VDHFYVYLTHQLHFSLLHLPYFFIDRFQQHRYKCDQAFGLDYSKSPVAQYLDIPTIVQICIRNHVEAVHPGYGFLSENLHFAQALEDQGIVFVGPTVQNLKMFGDKTTARNIAIANHVPVVAGSKEAFADANEAAVWIADPNNQCSYPVIVKALMGGGGRGIRIVPTQESLQDMFQQASNEAQNAFGDGRCFVEKYVEQPRHIEVQCLGDGTGNVIHLWDRDCSVQRRHQKVIELAPAEGLLPQTRQQILNDAVRLLSSEKYRNAGTVEFLVDKHGQHYFMEVNPRVQVEHTVTEEITGIDIVQSQIYIASGKTLQELQLTQDRIPAPIGFAMQVNKNGLWDLDAWIHFLMFFFWFIEMSFYKFPLSPIRSIQCRVTTEDPSQDFRPDTGTISVFRMPAGMGIRLDDGPGFPGARITPHYDSLLVKITAKARTRTEAAAKLVRALTEFRVRGVKTNKSFLLNVLKNRQFLDGVVDTGFIAANPQLMTPLREKDRAQKLLRYIGEVIVNGTPKELGRFKSLICYTFSQCTHLFLFCRCCGGTAKSH